MVEDGRDKTNLPYFTDDKGKFVPMWLAEDILSDENFAVHKQSDEIYHYEEGVYNEGGEGVLSEEAQKRLGCFVRNNYVNETIECIRRNHLLRAPSTEFGNPNDSIVVENGLLNVKKRELNEHSPEHIHIQKLPIKYNKNKNCPQIKKFIQEIVHKDDIKLIQEMFGYCLLKEYPIAKAFMLLGPGANGKSTLLKLLENFLGSDNIANPSLQQLLNNRFSRIELFGKLANLHADLSPEKLEQTGTFKMLTGDDLIRGEKKYQNAIKFRNYAKLIYSANELPKTKDRTEAFFRRWIIIEFPNQFPENDPDTDPKILEKIITEDELSGLLNWSLDGLERVLKNGKFSMSDSRKEIEQKWIMQTDSLRAFLDQAVVNKTDAWISKKDFYKLYKKFCGQNNIYIVKKGQVTKRLPTLEPTIELYRPEINGDRVRCWKNIEIDESFIKENDYVQDVQPLRTSSIAREEDDYKKAVSNDLDMTDTDENQGTIEDLGKNPNCEICLEEMDLEKEAEKKVRMDGKEMWLCEHCLKSRGYES